MDVTTQKENIMCIHLKYVFVQHHFLDVVILNLVLNEFFISYSILPSALSPNGPEGFFTNPYYPTKLVPYYFVFNYYPTVD